MPFAPICVICFKKLGTFLAEALGEPSSEEEEAPLVRQRHVNQSSAEQCG